MRRILMDESVNTISSDTNTCNPTVDEIANLVVDKMKMLDEDNLVKLDTDSAINMLTAITQRVAELQTEYHIQFCEIQNQKEDLDHLLGAQRVNGCSADVLEDTANKITDATILRRTIKDARTAMKVVTENLEKTCQFLKGVNNRYYTTKSLAYSNIGKIRAEIKNPDMSNDYVTHLKHQYKTMLDLISLRQKEGLIPDMPADDEDVTQVTRITALPPTRKINVQSIPYSHSQSRFSQ